MLISMAPTPAKALPKPTDSELELLRVLWKLGPATVRQVHESQDPAKTSGYTTTLKLMQIMAEKGLVQRDESAKAHLYSATLTEQHARKRMVGELVDRLFAGSTTQLVLHALANRKSSPKELEEIRELLGKFEGEKS